jgi:tRNA A-37 threonylcarbamoyl transferase component Bud32
MATVYLATDTELSRRVAIKLLHPELGANLGPERFLREIAFASRLSHPHILPLFESGRADGRLFYVMPFVEGETLRHRLEREAQLPLPETIRIVTAVASALDYAHRTGVVHRDIKPENILLARDSGDGPVHPVVADFGIARALDAAGGERLTETGLALGTPAYMSPEQAAGGGRLDGRSDVYALGCVAYEMLAGTPPFTGPSAQALMARHAVDRVPPLRTVRATVPEPVVAAIERALAKVPADRFATAGEFAEALAAPSAPWSVSSRWLSARNIGIAVGGAVVLAGVAAAVGVARKAGAPAVIASAARIAVVPLGSVYADTALARLGRDLAVTIAASLDGVGDVRTVDRQTIAAATTNRGTPVSLEESAALARRHGAGSVMHGTLVRIGTNVRLDFGLYEAAGLGPIARNLVITAPLDSLGALTDSVVWALLRQIWRRGEPPTPSLASVTTGSVPALRAFLDGERELIGNRWDGAALAYRSAIATDSTFWLAYERYAETQTWREEEIEPELLDRLARHRQALPERDRLLADAILSAREPSASRTLELYEQVTRRFPDYWPGWFLYGDRLVHFGGLWGFPWTRARDALQRALAGNPNLVPSWHHLFLISVGRDSALPALSAARLAELGFFATPGKGWAPHPGRQDSFRMLAELSRHDGSLPDSLGALADHAAQYAASGASPRDVRLTPTNLLLAGFPAAQIDANRRVLALGVEREIAAANLTSIALAWASRGAWDSALVASDSAVAVDPGPNSALEAYRLAVLGAWVGAIDPGEAVRRQRPAWLAAERLPADPPPVSNPARLIWLDGILAYVRGDRQGIAQARRALRQRPLPVAADLQEVARAMRSFNDRSLAAFEKALAGDRTAAGRALAALEWECAGLWTCGVNNYDLAVHHLASARWLLAAGDTAQTARLLRWHESFQRDSYWNGTLVLTPLAYLESARLEEARGDSVEAREHYHQFLRRFDAPLPSQRDLVEDARRALDRLSSSPSASSPTHVPPQRSRVSKVDGSFGGQSGSGQGGN